MYLKYKTYTAKVLFSPLTGSFYGEVNNLTMHMEERGRNDNIIFLASSQNDLLESMQQAINQYLDLRESSLNKTDQRELLDYVANV